MKIIKIYWVRSNLHIIFDNSVENAYLVGKNKYKFNVLNNEVSFNITNMPNMLEEGSYVLDIGCDYECDINLDKIFYYHKELCAYLVSIVSGDNLIIKTRYMVTNKKYKSLFRLCETNNILEKIKIIGIKFANILINLFYNLIYYLTFNKKVLLLSENSNYLSSNLSVIKNRLNNTMVFTYDKSLNKSFINYLKELYYISRSRVIVVDNYVSLLSHINLKKEVKFIQIWHAGVGFKSVGYARFGMEGSPHPFISSHRKYNLVVVDREELIPVYSEVFGVDKDIIKPWGLPRLDGYLNRDNINKELEKLYSLNRKFKEYNVVLFAPTYRGVGINEAYYDYDKLDFDSIYKLCKKKKILFVIKMHPFIKDKINIKKEYSDLIVDYSNLDINNLIYCADVLITDYSSCVYEYSLFNRPIIFYRYDKKDYEMKRAIYTNYDYGKEQYEVFNMGDLIEKLNSIKIDKNKRFTNMGNHKSYLDNLIKYINTKY